MTLKLTADTKSLSVALATAASVAAARSPRPQLTCLLMEGAKVGGAGVLTLSATDAESAIRLTVPAIELHEPGACLVPAAKLRQIISAEDHEPTINLSGSDGGCGITSSGAKYQIHGYPAKDFPPTREMPEAAQSLTGGMLAEIAKRTTFCTSNEISRYAMPGVYIVRDGKKIEAVATDGRRMVIYRTKAGEAAPAGSRAFLVHGRALQRAAGFVADPEEPVRIAEDAGAVFFDFGPGRVLFSSLLIEGTFPPYLDVIPKDPTKTVKVNREAMLSALQRAAITTSVVSRSVAMEFQAKAKKLTIKSRAPEEGQTEVSIPIESYEGEDIAIGFNPGFVADGLKAIPEPIVTLEMSQPSRPMVVKSDGFIYVVMPVALS